MRAQKPASPTRLDAAEEGDAALVDAVAELRQHRRQHRERADHATRRPRRSSRWRTTRSRGAGQVHPAHRDHDREARDQHRAAGRGGRRLERRLLAAPGGALLALAPDVEQRSSRPPPPARSAGPRVDRLRRPATIWLSGPSSPSVASTAVSASSRGMPAATNVPKAITRMISVIGNEVISAFWKSSSKLFADRLLGARVAELLDAEVRVRLVRPRPRWRAAPRPPSRCPRGRRESRSRRAPSACPARSASCRPRRGR